MPLNLQNFFKPGADPEALKSTLAERLHEHDKRRFNDPQSNAIELLAYDLSRALEDRELAYTNIESLIKNISDEAACKRAKRLGRRAGLDKTDAILKSIADIAGKQAEKGFEAFRHWLENPGLGIVLTAHPTFSLPAKVRNVLGAIAASPPEAQKTALKTELSTLSYHSGSAPTLQEEHADTQETLGRMQHALEDITSYILQVAENRFPERWTELKPALANLYSWVGYDIDGRTDIKWGDALRLRLEEKTKQLSRYDRRVTEIINSASAPEKAAKVLTELSARLSDAYKSAQRDLALFQQDLNEPENLVAAANNLTRESDRRLLNMVPVLGLINEAVKHLDNGDQKRSLIILRGQMVSYGLGTSRIHFRVNARHIKNALMGVFQYDENTSDSRTLLLRAAEITKTVEPIAVNFASLALEKSTAHQQMIMATQFHKYIDDTVPIRMLIAETEDSVTVMGMLYLARLYGLENTLDISPLFETSDALYNGGRIIEKLLSNPVYREYIDKRGVFAIQTGFSDAGRYMGQIPATLAIERLQSHFANVMARHNMQHVRAIIFNTHGESMGRGGHPGNIKDRVDYVLSPWIRNRFSNRDIDLCHETSFQGGDGFMWFQTPELAKATIASLILARFADNGDVENDGFYTEKDFSWDIFRTLSAEQGSLYQDPNYVSILGGFGQNLLIQTGSRAVKRSSTGTGVFNPRQLRAIPHNAILQQMGTLANLVYGMGRAASIDPEKIAALNTQSPRARIIFSMAGHAMERTDFSILSSYARLFDPGFWIGRADSGQEPRRRHTSLLIAHTVRAGLWRAQVINLSNRLRIDANYARNFLTGIGHSANEAEENNDTIRILHALRLALIMRTLILATQLPTHGDEGVSQLNVLQRLQSFEVDEILEDLEEKYPRQREELDWVSEIAEQSGSPARTGGFPHISESIINPMRRTAEIVRQTSLALTHQFDAFG